MTTANDSRRAQSGFALTLICAVFLIAGVHAARAGVNEWTIGPGTSGDHVDALAIDPRTPSTLYAGGSWGLLQSTDSAGSWSAVNFPGLPVFDPITPTRLYAVGSGGVYKSTNSGASWAATGLTVGVGVLAIDPTTPSTLYAAGNGVFQSTDSGVTWSGVNTGLTDPYVSALAIDPQTPSTLYAATYSCAPCPPICWCGGGRVFRSTNSGASWSATGSTSLTTQYVNALAIDPRTPSTLYAGTTEPYSAKRYAGVFQSTDRGTSWSALNSGLNTGPVLALAINPRTPSTLYAGTTETDYDTNDGGVFRSTNSGASWRGVNSGLTPRQAAALAIDPQDPTRLYAGNYGGVFDIELTCVVGTGKSGSCGESALDACLPGGAGFNGVVTFNCGASPVTITVTSTKTISADTTIDGGSLVTISGGNSVGVFSVNSGVTLTVQNLTIANGSVMVVNSGGIVNEGALTVTNSTFSGNRAGGSCGPEGFPSAGGAIRNLGTLTVTNSTFSGNIAYCGFGGAINNMGGTLTVTNSTFSGNRASAGGGIDSSDGTLTVTNCTFSGNNAVTNGGGILNAGTLTVTNSTFSGNSSAGIIGGGIATDGPATVTNTILADNTAGNCIGTITDGGHNLDDGTSCGFSTANGSLSNKDPKLDPAGLQNNGGPTDTIALLPDSRAIDSGDPEVCASPPVNGVDQRGYRRPGGGLTNCSIGAYEYGAWELPLCDGDCNGDGEITVDEVITGVNIALGNISVCECMPCDTDNNGLVSIAELIRAVNYALSGCPFWNAEGLGRGGELRASAQARLREMQARCVE